ncbi:Plastid movement impaired1 [Zostera marina]|uniref:Plastid movement impaired1 n=1 Tax=Zostera marina TaxID=29655 RepID=A0A0K9Q4Y5_ZOSMR|nr:Plastid movement impaired1 [Zostera marina]
MAGVSGGSKSNKDTQQLQELEALSQTLYQSHNARRTNSLILPRSSDKTPPNHYNKQAQLPTQQYNQNPPRSRRLSSITSPWRSRQSPKPSKNIAEPSSSMRMTIDETETIIDSKKKGIWNWKPMRAISHIGMQKMACLFSVEVLAIQGLPASMNGLRLSVLVRKMETKEGAVQTMPSRVLQGTADFEETMYIRCSVYCTGGPPTGKPLKLEPRPFFINVTAIEAPELDLGNNSIDLSSLVRESIETNIQGERIRKWDQDFILVGKARGGQLMLKLGFQIMEDGGVGIYSQPISEWKTSTPRVDSPSFARKQSKYSFSITSPRTTPSKMKKLADHKEIDEFKLDEPTPPSPAPLVNLRPASKKSKEDDEEEDDEFPEFQVLDKGILVEKKETKSGSGEANVVVKEVVIQQQQQQNPKNTLRLEELNAIANQIKDMESTILLAGKTNKSKFTLDPDEETATREFLQMLDLQEIDNPMLKSNTKLNIPKSLTGISINDKDNYEEDEEVEKEDESPNSEPKAFISDLGKRLGPVVQTKDGGYLTSANPSEGEVQKKEAPKLAIQMSKPLIITDHKSNTGFELFQRLAAMGSEMLKSKLVSMSEMDDLTGKTPEQVAFEGVATSIISGRSDEEGANSSTAKLFATLKNMSSAMSSGRRERARTDVWKTGGEKKQAVVAEELLAYSLQRIESMSVEALKIQAGMTGEEAPFEVFPVYDNEFNLDSIVTLEEWMKTNRNSKEEEEEEEEEEEKEGRGVGDDVTVVVVLLMRDPARNYEKVGTTVVGMVQAVGIGNGKYKVGSVHVGGMMGNGGERLTAMQWMVECGICEGKKMKDITPRGGGGRGRNVIWSLSSRIMADMWLKAMRNPDIKFQK